MEIRIRRTAAGLCEKCRNARIVDAKSGSRFYLCKLSFVDPAYPKYPPIPVLACAGFDPQREA